VGARLADRAKSDIYRDALPIFNSRNVSLLDNPTLVGQLCALERSTGTSGRDKIDHPRGAHDDLCNAACGAICLATQKRRRFERTPTIGLPITFEGDRRVEFKQATQPVAYVSTSLGIRADRMGGGASGHHET
jgi:hypothetical protein